MGTKKLKSLDEVSGVPADGRRTPIDVKVSLK